MPIPTQADANISVSNHAKWMMTAQPISLADIGINSGSGLDQAAVDARVTVGIAAWVGAAPGALDTLAEIAAQLATDEGAVATLTSTVAGKLAIASNLSDLASAATARSNLGLGTAATTASTDYATAAHSHTFAAITSKPTTLAGYAISDAVGSGDARLTDARTPLSHVHTFASLTSIPTTLAGYGISDAAASSHTHTFASLTSKPTTLSGYGITDAATAAQGALAATALQPGIAATQLTSGVIDPARLGSGGAAGKFLRFDNTWQTIAGGGDMLALNNLSDVLSAAVARTNLGLGTAATTAATAYATAAQGATADLSAVASTTTAALALKAPLAAPTFTGILTAATVTASGAVTGSNLSGTNTGDRIGYTLAVQALTSSPADAVTIYFGNNPKAPVTAAATIKVFIPKTGTIKRADIYCQSGTAGTNEAWPMYIRLNNTTDTLIASVALATQERIFANSSLSIAVTAGDYIEIKSVNPTWVTNPLTTTFGGQIYIET